MAGRLIHPLGRLPPQWPAWTEPLWTASNAALAAALAPAMLTGRMRVAELPRNPRGPTIFITWHRFNMAAALALRALPERERPTLLMHDGLVSRAITHDSSVWLGFEVLVSQRRAPVPVRDQIAEFLRGTTRSLLVLPDAGGPYGTMKPGIVDVARRVDAHLVPLWIRARRALTLGATLRHVFPLPRCELELVAGAPMPAERASVEACQQALDALASG